LEVLGSHLENLRRGEMEKNCGEGVVKRGGLGGGNLQWRGSPWTGTSKYAGCRIWVGGGLVGQRGGRGG